MGKLTRYDHTFRGQLAWRENGNGCITRYEYDSLERLKSVTDAGGVPLLRMEQDVLGNTKEVVSFNNQQLELSSFSYSRDGLNRVTNAICLLTNIPDFSAVKYSIDYEFDPVSNVTNRLITGLQGLSGTIQTRYAFDAMDRLTQVVQLTNAVETATAGYTYDALGRLSTKTYGNNDVITQKYDLESRLVSLALTNGANPVLWNGYSWDAASQLQTVTNNGSVVFDYAYDGAGQLTNEVVSTNGGAGATNTWVYDEAGNWISSAGEGQWRTYNDDNESVLVANTQGATNAVTVTGLVEAGPKNNDWLGSTAECRGAQAAVNPNNGTFSIPGVPVYPGENALAVTVTDASGNASQQTRHVTNAALETFSYDGNGNLTNWMCGAQKWVYEWDWADRLTKVSSNGVVLLQNWYDAESRRIAKQELVDGQTRKWLYLYDGWNIIAVMNESGQLLETFTRGVGLAGDIGGLVAVTHHTGSASTPGTYYVHNNHRGDVVMTRSGTTTVGSYAYSAFGRLISQTETDVCRFKFSSKEREPSCGFSYYGFRFYAPQWQRWPNRDPIGEWADPIPFPINFEMNGVFGETGGEEIGSVNEGVFFPFADNLFNYVSNDPIGKVDLLGLKASIPDYAACVAVCMLTGDATAWGATMVATHQMSKFGEGAERRLAQKTAKRMVKKLGLRVGMRLGLKLIPGIGTALIAVDAARCAFQCRDKGCQSLNE